MQVADFLSAWAIQILPVRFARRCIKKGILPLKEEPNCTQQLLVDVSVIYQVDARTGIQRVVRALLLQLLNAPPNGFKICPVFSTRQHGYCYASTDFLMRLENETKKIGKAVSVQYGDIFLGLDLAAHLLPRQEKQLLSWKNAGVSVHIFVYDILPLLHPQWFPDKTTRNFRRWIKLLAVYADSAICISETVKNELSIWLDENFGLIPGVLPASVIALGADINASFPTVGLPLNIAVLLAIIGSARTVLMVGTLEPRKGYDHALAAFDLLWQNKKEAQPLLVIVGKSGWKTERLQADVRQHPELGRRLFWLENASDELLELLYKNCSGVLVASYAEGFGLPIIEAALHQKSVLARDISVFREINLPCVSYFTAETPQLLAIAIHQWIFANQTVFFASIDKFSTWEFSVGQLISALGLLPRDSVINLNGNCADW